MLYSGTEWQEEVSYKWGKFCKSIHCSIWDLQVPWKLHWLPRSSQAKGMHNIASVICFLKGFFCTWLYPDSNSFFFPHLFFYLCRKCLLLVMIWNLNVKERTNTTVVLMFSGNGERDNIFMCQTCLVFTTPYFSVLLLWSLALAVKK